MKYLYSIVGFIAFLLTMTVVTNFKYITDYETYDMQSNKIEKIVIDTANINVNISSTLDKDIKIEHIYSDSDNPESNVYTHIENNTLNIREYKNDVTNVLPKKETVNVYLPVDTKFEKLMVSTSSGKINVDGTSIPKIHIESDTGSVEVGNLETNTLQVEGQQFALKLSNLKAKQIFTHMKQTNITLNSILANEINIKNDDQALVKASKIVTKDLIVTGEMSDVELTLQDNQNYVIESNQELSNKQLKAIDGGYELKFVDNDTQMKINALNVKKLKLNITEGNVEDE